MYDNDLKATLTKLKAEAEGAFGMQRDAMQAQDNSRIPAERSKLAGEIDKYRITLQTSVDQFNSLLRIHNADQNRLGVFWLKAPPFTDLSATKRERWWTVLDADFREKLHQTVKPTDPIVRLGNVDGRWELELKIPQK